MPPLQYQLHMTLHCIHKDILFFSFKIIGFLPYSYFSSFTFSLFSPSNTNSLFPPFFHSVVLPFGHLDTRNKGPNPSSYLFIITSFFLLMSISPTNIFSASPFLSYYSLISLFPSLSSLPFFFLSTFSYFHKYFYFLILVSCLFRLYLLYF
ncbi:unnamed protein product [Acanthosepion pharaonis]|uniref:Uncharacterized protein n=1 Tax=Acanthosepion pharaonis TaxID=158019 RepID=A0A812B5P3_ACAPH|nr:unnamed protein product [Sepia pharaonis]